MKPTKNPTLNYWKALKIAGAFMAYLIGSGFATGQEAMQFFVAYGYKGILGGVISLLLFTYACHSLYQIGYQFKLRRNEDVFVHYCGKYIGVFLTWYTMIFILAVHSIMLSGTGATLQEYFGFPTYIGAGIMAICSMLTLLLGLRQIVNIISLIGPIIVVFTLLIAAITIFHNPTAFPKGAARIAEIDLLKATPHWLLSCLTYVGLCLPGLASFLPAIGADSNSVRDLKAAAILGPFLFVGAMLLLTIALMIQIDEAAGTMIPVMALAKNILPVFESFFVVIIFLGIYSTATPLLWTIVARFAEDKTTTYNVLVVVLTGISFFGGMLLPFDQMVNLIYPTIGYVGMFFLMVMIGKDIAKKIATNCL